MYWQLMKVLRYFYEHTDHSWVKAVTYGGKSLMVQESDPDADTLAFEVTAKIVVLDILSQFVVDKVSHLDVTVHLK